MIVFGLGSRHRLPQHVFTRLRFLVVGLHALSHVFSGLFKLPLYFIQVALGLAVFAVVRAVHCRYIGQFLFCDVYLVLQAAQIFALLGNHGRGHTAVLHGFESGLLRHAVRLRLGVILIQLQQSLRKDIGLVLGIDDIQLLLKFGQRQP